MVLFHFADRLAGQPAALRKVGRTPTAQLAMLLLCTHSPPLHLDLSPEGTERFRP
jgi:hypothetical protein